MTQIKIYEIRDLTNDNVYIGSTAQPHLSNRIARHRSYMKNQLQYCSSSIVLKNNNYFYKCIEVCDVSVRKEREKYYINNTPNCINLKKLNFNKKEWEKEKIECTCGAIICRAGLCRHLRTNKHINNI